MTVQFRKAVANRLASILRKNGEVDKLESELVKAMKMTNLKRRKLESHIYIQQSPDSDELFNIRNQNVSKMFCNDVIYKCSVRDVNEEKQFHIEIFNGVYHKTILESIKRLGSGYGYDRFNADRKKVVVEYSSPNIAKPFHVGHLKSTIIGNVIANLYEAFGHKVTRINYLGDWGTQKALLVLAYMKHGEDAKLKEDPLRHLFELYVNIHREVREEKEQNQSSNNSTEAKSTEFIEYQKSPVRWSPTYKEALELFQRLESGDSDLLEIWQTFKKISLEEYDKIYKRIGIQFDEVHFESDYKESTQDLLASLKEQNILQLREDNLGYIDITVENQARIAAIQKSDGTSLYLTRDITAAFDRYKKYQFDAIHYVMGIDQEYHCLFLHECLKQLQPEVWNSLTFKDSFILFGGVKGMSSRKGQVVFLRDVLDEASTRVKNLLKNTETTKSKDESSLEKISDNIGMSSVFVYFLSKRREATNEFDWSKILCFTADSGLFLQYCHARLVGLEKENVNLLSSIEEIDVNAFREIEAIALLQELASYPVIVEEALKRLEPCVIVQYLFSLGHKINKAYRRLPVKNEEEDVAKARLLLFECARQTLANGMKILGIEPLDEM